MSPDLEHRPNTPAPDGVEPTPLVKAERRIEKFLAPFKVDSLEFLAVEDYADSIDLEYMTKSLPRLTFLKDSAKADMTIMKSFKAYRGILEQTTEEVYDYWREVTRGISDPSKRQEKFAEGLKAVIKRVRDRKEEEQGYIQPGQK